MAKPFFAGYSQKGEGSIFWIDEEFVVIYHAHERDIRNAMRLLADGATMQENFLGVPSSK